MTVAEAAASGDIEKMRILLDAGGDPNEAETEEFKSPFLEAIDADCVEAARLLLEAGADMYALSEGEGTALTIAATGGRINTFRLLVELDYRIDATRDWASYMLGMAAGRGYLEIVSSLLSQGIDADMADDRHGQTPLMGAVASDHVEIAEELIRAGANVNARDNDTQTPLMWAADHEGGTEVIRILLRAGADVNAYDSVDFSALSWAIQFGDIAMIRVLLDAGAIVIPADFERGLRLADLARLTGPDGQTALDLVQSRGYSDSLANASDTVADD